MSEYTEEASFEYCGVSWRARRTEFWIEVQPVDFRERRLPDPLAVSYGSLRSQLDKHKNLKEAGRWVLCFMRRKSDAR